MSSNRDELSSTFQSFRQLVSDLGPSPILPTVPLTSLVRIAGCDQANGDSEGFHRGSSQSSVGSADEDEPL